jgi:hypothetical protein
MNSAYGKSNGPALMAFTAQATTMLGYGIAYNGSSKLVLVGQLPASPWSALTATSTDSGVTWTTSSSLTTAFGATNAVCVAWSGTRFFTMAGGPLGAYSTDGITWTASSSFATAWNTSPYFQTSPQFVDWFPTLSKFLAVGDGGVICSSSDGITWTWGNIIPSINSGGNYAMQIAYGNGKYIAVGTSGRSSYSTTTASGTWNAGNVTGFSTYDITGIAYSSTLGIWVAIGGVNAACMAASSPDGTTWTTRTSFNTATNTVYAQQGSVNTGRVRWHASLGKFVAIELWGVITSVDGINWVLETNLLTLSASANIPHMQDSAYTGSKLAIANSGSNFSGNTYVYTSP